MRDAQALRALCATGRPFALATVVGASGSTPRPVGAVMAVSADGAVVGSLSGGCVEGAVLEVARAVLTGAPASVETFGVSDEGALEIGLTCGGAIEVLVARADGHLLGSVLDAAQVGTPVALATAVTGPARGAQLALLADGPRGTLGHPQLDATVVEATRGLLAAGTDATVHRGPAGECDGTEVAVLVQVLAPAPRLLLVGATDFSAALARVGRVLGYAVSVCDPRQVFATRERFPDADEVVCAWPATWIEQQVLDSSTAVALLTHDDRFDVEVLATALRSGAAYVGAMGSRRTHDSRVRRLREAGVDEEQLARLRSPIGLDLGGRTPEETAVSIAAELVQSRWSGTGLPLAQLDGAVHRSLQLR